MLRQEFHFSHPEALCPLNTIYNGSFYGTGIWDLTCPAAISLYNSWSSAVRTMWQLPRDTHRSLIEPLGGRHAASTTAINYSGSISFILKSSNLPAIYQLFSSLYNAQSKTVKNMEYIMNRLKFERRHFLRVKNWDQSIIKQNFKFTDGTPSNWGKVTAIKELTEVKKIVM